MPVAMPDILSSDGRYVYMRTLPFDLEGNRKVVGYTEFKNQVVKCENLATVVQADILDTIGHLSDELTTRLDTCLQAALELS